MTGQDQGGNQNFLLRQAREEHQLSQSEAAAEIGVSERTYRRWENEGSIPSYYARRKLTTFFGKKEDELGIGKHTRQTLSSPSRSQETIGSHSEPLKPSDNSALIEPLLTNSRFALSPQETSAPLSSDTVLQKGKSVQQKASSPEVDQTVMPALTSFLPGSQGKKEPITLSSIVTLPTAKEEQIPSLAVEERDRNQQIMLKRVYDSWIADFLEYALLHIPYISLHFRLRRNAVADPWAALREQHVPDDNFTPGTTITEIYDTADRSLLILGDPGAGKTMLLLKLVKSLLERARKNVNDPLPVVFVLSSWSVKKQPLADWLVDELYVKYQVPHKIGRQWIEQESIFPVLDGLDEVHMAHRSFCIEVINTYRDQHGLSPLVVSCRSTEYFAQTKRLKLRMAIIIQPLNKEQIDVYLNVMGNMLDTIQGDFQAQTDLYELASTPLMLDVLARTYQGIPGYDIQFTVSSEKQRQQLLDKYIERMLHHHRAQSKYKAASTMYWLAWLAHQMKEHGLTEFYLEQLQIDWLSKHRFYQILLVFAVGVVYGILTMLFYTIEYWNLYPHSKSLMIGVQFGLFTMLIFTLVNGLVALLPDVSKTDTTVLKRIGIVDLGVRIRRAAAFPFIERILYGLVIGTLLALFASLLFEPSVAIADGFYTAEFYASMGKVHVEILPTEAVSLSWGKAKKNMLKAMGVGVFIGSLYECIASIIHFDAIITLGTAIATTLTCMLSFLVVTSISSKMGASYKRIIPNQGIVQSVRNGSLLALGLGATYTIIYSGTIIIINMFAKVKALGIEYYFTYILPICLLITCMWWLRYGGIAWIQHYFLRFLLFLFRYTPYKYTSFLDYAAKCILLHKKGGGYIFIHSLFLDYFASLDLNALRKNWKRS